MNGPVKTYFGIGALVLLLGSGTASATVEQPVVRAVAGFESARTTGQRHDMASATEAVATEKKTSVAEAVATEEKTSVAGEKSVSTAAESASCCAHYVYSGHTELFDDWDYDGFHTFLRVNVDVDTDFFESDLYVEVYLRGSDGGWLRIYESEVFTIHGTSALDDYEVESELVSGFKADYYDVLVEVYDAYSGDLVTSYGPLENSSFALLPLEDVNRDAPVATPIVNSHGSGGGAVSTLGLLALTGLYVLRRRRLSRTIGPET